jgi:CheY-like chemotaxis protein
MKCNPSFHMMPRNVPSIPGIWSSRSFEQVNPPVAVLIVDEERATADALAAALAVDGFRTSVAESGYAALTTPQAWTPHVVILDIEMPFVMGFRSPRPCGIKPLRASKRLRKKSGVLIGVARKLPERKSDQYCFREFDNSQTSSHHSLALAPRSSEGATP